jgi:hypothetical protein
MRKPIGCVLLLLALAGSQLLAAERGTAEEARALCARAIEAYKTEGRRISKDHRARPGLRRPGSLCLRHRARSQARGEWQHFAISRHILSAAEGRGRKSVWPGHDRDRQQRRWMGRIRIRRPQYGRDPAQVDLGHAARPLHFRVRLLPWGRMKGLRGPDRPFGPGLNPPRAGRPRGSGPSGAPASRARAAGPGRSRRS